MSQTTLGQFPHIRMRRGRRSAALRRLAAEARLSVDDLIYPVFVLEGKDQVEAVPSMPGVSRKSIDKLLIELTEARDLGIPAVALFPVIDASRKTPDGSPTARNAPIRTGWFKILFVPSKMSFRSWWS